MDRLMSIDEFAVQVHAIVKKALPEELSTAEVYTQKLKIWDGEARTVLLVIRPWDGTTTGFCLDKHYAAYHNGEETVESAAAIIINDRRLYSIPTDGTDGASGLQGAAVIYA